MKKDEILEEIAHNQETIDKLINSRLNKGILFVPEGLYIAPEEGYTEDFDNLVEELVEAFAEPVPEDHVETRILGFIIRGPKELMKEVKHLKPETTDRIEGLHKRNEYLQERLAVLENAED